MQFERLAVVAAAIVLLIVVSLGGTPLLDDAASLGASGTHADRPASCASPRPDRAA